MHDIKEIEHTADIGFIVKADTLEELLETCAKILIENVVDIEKVETKEEKRFTIDFDREFVVIDFLRELLYIFETEEFVWGECKVKIENERVEFILKGEKFFPKKHKIKKDIKAITYHNYYLKKNSIWETQFIFDI